MNVAVLKTKTEQTLSEAFASAAAELPGGAEVRAVRVDAIGRFGSLGLPHRRIEAWKYTDLRNVLKEALPLSVAQAAAGDAGRRRGGAGPIRRRCSASRRVRRWCITCPIFPRSSPTAP